MKVWPSAHPTVLQRTVGPELLRTVSEETRKQACCSRYDVDMTAVVGS